MLSPTGSENRQPAPLPQTPRFSGRIGWLTALALGVLAALLVCRNFELTTTVRIMQNEATLAQVEEQSLKQQLDAERIVAARQIADLTAQSASAPMIFVNLVASQPGEAKPSATLAWQPAVQAGVFIADQLPPLAADEEYRLWLEDTSGHSVGAGAVTVGPTGATRAEFRAEQPMKDPARITLTRERKGVVTQPTGPILLIGSL